MLWILVIVVVLVLLGIFVWSTHNGLIRAGNSVDANWSDIMVALKRRADLIPNLVETVKGYSTHERQVFENVTEARAQMLTGADQGPAAAAAAEGQVQSALRSLFAVAEAYPDLRASENFQALQHELSGTENRIADSREHYNGSVRVFNSKIQSFPANMIADNLGYSEREYYEVPDSAAIQPPPTAQL